MKKIYLIHGWGGDNEGGWFKPLTEKLREQGLEVIAPNMPETINPKIERWVGFLQENIKNIDKDTYFIGHSIGCQAIMRYLEGLDKEIKIGGCIFVAGWFNLTDKTWDEQYTKEIAKPWLNKKINFDKIKKHTEKFLAIFSDDDPVVPLTDANLFKNNLNANIIIIKERGHIEEFKEEEFNSILEFIESE